MKIKTGLYKQYWKHCFFFHLLDVLASLELGPTLGNGKCRGHCFFFHFFLFGAFENGKMVLRSLITWRNPLTLSRFTTAHYFVAIKQFQTETIRCFASSLIEHWTNPWLNVNTIHFQISRRLQSNPELSLRVTVKSRESCLCSVNICRDLVKKTRSNKGNTKIQRTLIDNILSLFCFFFFLQKCKNTVLVGSNKQTIQENPEISISNYE